MTRQYKRFNGEPYNTCWCDKHQDEVDGKNLCKDGRYVDDECLHGVCKECKENPKPEPVKATFPKTIDLTPTWLGVYPIWEEVVLHGNEQSKRVFLEEFKRLCALTDKNNAENKSGVAK